MIIAIILFGIAFACYVIYSDNRYGKLFEENKKLKEKVEEKQSSTNAPRMTVDMVKNPDYNQPLRQNSVPVNSIPVRPQVKQSTQTIKPKTISNEEKQKIQSEKETKEREKKNIAILITGAILIVLAAIVFLLSTWNSIADVVKTITILFVGGVFLGASKIAKDNFNLPKTSKTFFYIAMAYIPICLLSIWIFGLFGEYLAIYGGGSSLYLTIACLIVAGLYYYIYRYHNNKGMLYGSIIAQVLTAIFFVHIFTLDFGATLAGVLLYNILLALYAKYCEKDNILFIDVLNHILAYGASVISVPQILFIALFGEWLKIDLSLAFVFANILSIANFAILYFERGKEKVHCYFANIFIALACVSTTTAILRDIPDVAKAIFATVYLLVANSIQRVLKNKDFIQASDIITEAVLPIVYLYSLFSTNGLLAGFVALAQVAFSIVLYIKNGKVGKWIHAVLIPSYLIIGIISIFGYYNLNYHAFLISFLALNIIAEIFKDFRKDLHVSSLIVTHIVTFAAFLSLCVTEDLLLNPLYFFALTAIYAITYLRNKKWYAFKYFSYISATLSLGVLFNYLNLDKRIICYSPMILSVAITLLETQVESIKDKLSEAFVIASQIIAFCLIGFVTDEINIVVTIIYALLVYYYNIHTKKHNAFNLIPLLSVLAITLSSTANDDFLTMIRLVLVTALTGYTIYKRELSFETLFSAIFLFTTFGVVEGYARYFILIIWSAINMAFVEKNSHKDIFKVALYISGFMLYRQVITELGIINEYMSFIFMGITVLYDLILKNVVNKYAKETEILDYFFYIIFNLFVVSRFLSVTDGLIYVVFLIGSIMFSYVLGWGSVFFASIASLGINIVYLTREFWLSVPWYIYLLLAGGTLIGFAIINELNEKKNNVNIGKTIVKFKQDIDNNKFVEKSSIGNDEEKK